MKFGLLSFAALAVAICQAAPASNAKHTYNCTAYSTHDLKWHSLDNDDFGYLSISNLKDDQGRPILTTLEKDGSPAKPVKFVRTICDPPEGTKGYMGIGKGSKSNGVSFGHIALESDQSKCVTATGLEKKGINFVLDKCHKQNSAVQLKQFFGEAVNGITLNFMGHKYGSQDKNYELHIGKGKGNPIEADFVGSKQSNSSVFFYWLKFPNQ
ncbi:hypothetical protein MVES1_002877 [Malassezia vespertilionis]|uniref:Uncharacterized protein n=1 Tax=Malassezia vespertilionis TaxID=2020962 RepID=A0A2N1JAK2_9BASI|nr:uncharacterized protein MVES1_002877 [Malassezia vespertilionis]PKI83522.1 hypothetical protein MVES_002724 [Malassezia vespertilionis]WFD07511.1 hypothetical protein MVES1_002877 [Malassezia vespertilionis]